MSVREREEGGEQSGPMEGPAPKEREAGQVEARRSRYRMPRDALLPLKVQAQSLPHVPCCLSGPEPVPFLPACQGQAQGGAGTIPPVPVASASSSSERRQRPAPLPGLS